MLEAVQAEERTVHFPHATRCAEVNKQYANRETRWGRRERAYASKAPSNERKHRAHAHAILHGEVNKAVHKNAGDEVVTRGVHIRVECPVHCHDGVAYLRHL